MNTMKNLLLRKISNTLLVNTQYVCEKGLAKGYMGIALFFYEYARYTGIERYEAFGAELIEKVVSSLKELTDLSFYHGLPGVGWCLDYLIHSNFIEADPDDFLEDLDKFFSNKFRDETLSASDRLHVGIYLFSRSRTRYADPAYLSLPEKYKSEISHSLFQKAFFEKLTVFLQKKGNEDSFSIQIEHYDRLILQELYSCTPFYEEGVFILKELDDSYFYQPDGLALAGISLLHEIPCK